MASPRIPSDPASPQPSIFQRVRDWFRWTRPARSTPVSPVVTDTPDFFNTQFRASIDAASGQNALLRDVVHEVARNYWKAGHADSRRGQRRAEFDDVVRASAEFFKQEFLSVSKAQTEELGEEMDAKKAVRDRAKTGYDACASHLEIISGLFRANPRSISLLLVIAYLTVAALLVAADIPLALVLTQQGFDLSLGRPPLEDLLKRPWAVFQNNWEVVILAVGLALSTVYIKIFHDAHAATRIPTTAPDSDAPGARRHWFDWFVLTLTLGTILVLGAFRYATNQRYAAAGAMVPLFSPTQDAIITLVTFVMITLVFPVIGGVCLSLGLDHWHNRKALRRAKEDAARSHREYLEASDAVESLQRTLAEWTAVHGWCSTAAFVETVQKLLSATYNHGYQRGWMETFRSGADIVSSAIRLRAYMVAHRLRDMVNDGRTSDAMLKIPHLHEQFAEPREAQEPTS